MTTVNIKPTIYGQVARTMASNLGEYWPVIRGGAGTDAGNTYANVGFSLRCSQVDDKYCELYKGCLIFPLASIPSGALVSSIVFHFIGNTKNDNTGTYDFDFAFVNAPTLYNNQLVPSDYNRIGSTLYAPTISYDDFGIGSWNNITLNSAAILAMNLALTTGYFKMGVRELNYDKNGATPPYVELANPGMDFHTLGSPIENDCYLEVTYDSTGVLTLPATEVSYLDARLNGKLLFLIPGKTAHCNFEWGLTESYGNTTSDIDLTAAAQFSEVVTGLDPGKSYHYRAVAVVDGTTYYGTDEIFSTYFSVGVEMAFGQSIFTDPASATWTDVSSELMGIDITRGRMHELDRIEAGTAVIKMSNTSGNWWRNNAAGTYYPDVKPRTLCRITSIYNATFPLFYGYIEKIPPRWTGDGGHGPVVEIALVDFFKIFAKYSFTITSTRAAELSGARVGWILDQLAVEAGLGTWPSGLKNVDTGTVEIMALPAGTYNVLDELQKTAQAECGLILQATDGKITFYDSQDRTTSPHNTVQAIFSDGGSQIVYVEPKLSDDDEFIYNIAHIKGDNVDQTVKDAAGPGAQGPSLWEVTDSRLNNNSDAFVQSWVIINRFNDSKFRCESLLVCPDVNPTILFPIVFSYDISTLINLELNSDRNPASLAQDYHIEGVHHHWDKDPGNWETEWQLWEVNPFLIFNPEHSGYLHNLSLVSYSDCHEAADGADANEDTGVIKVGQDVYGAAPNNTWEIWRGVSMLFDTTDIDPTETIIGAILLLHQKSGDNVSDSFDLTAVGDPPVHEPLEVADYGAINSKTTDLGHVTIPTGATTSEWLVIELNATGRATINKGGTTTFCLRSSEDIANSESSNPPAKTNHITLDDGTTSYKPVLIIMTQA